MYQTYIPTNETMRKYTVRNLYEQKQADQI